VTARPLRLLAVDPDCPRCDGAGWFYLSRRGHDTITPCIGPGGCIRPVEIEGNARIPNLLGFNAPTSIPIAEKQPDHPEAGTLADVFEKEDNGEDQ
jgi:hypothetical protein